ncbi:protein kinase [Asticcacaulis sp.]|uniref:protein kinase n=1 Tax=Asticcacaulis sp. TaxID=1872648 RepID=UPI002606FDBB|nr:protein kinase [Asticcacaulis sp.]
MANKEIHRTMARPIAQHINLLLQLAEKEYKLRLQRGLSVQQREKKVTEILAETEIILDSLAVAKRRTMTVPRVCCADIINRPDSVEVDVGWQETFDIARGKNSNESFILELKDLLQQGDYGFVYNATWTSSEMGKADRRTAAVVKVAKIPSNNLWMLLEFVIHSFLMKNSALKPFFTHLLGAAVAHNDTWPYRELLIVQAYHPGVDMYEYLNEYSFNDRSLIAAIQQIAFIIYHAQIACRFMHRDLKVENVMIFDANTMDFPDNILDKEKELFHRPPYYVCNEVEFNTENIAIQLIDLGSSTITLTDSNTTIACTTNRHPDTNNYNTAADMANFCLTLFLDYEQVLAIRAPMLHAYLQKAVQPMLDHMKNFPNESVDIVSHKCASADFVPQKLIKTLQALRIGLVQQEMENRAMQEMPAIPALSPPSTVSLAVASSSS